MRSFRPLFFLPCLFCLASMFLMKPRVCRADAFSDASSQMAANIASRLNTRAAVAFAFKNISSLGSAEAAVIGRTLRIELRRRGMRFAAAASNSRYPQVRVTLAENVEGYLLVAEISHSPERASARPAAVNNNGDLEVSMVTIPRPDSSLTTPSPQALVIRKTLLFTQDAPILDLGLAGAPGVADTESNRLLVLDPERVSIYRIAVSRWTLEQSLPIQHSQARPRDPRGRLVLHADGQFEAYLPGEICNGELQPAPVLACRETDEPWPLWVTEIADDRSGEHTGQPTLRSAFFTPSKNFFDGRVRSQTGEELKVAPFFSATAAQKNNTLLIFTGLDGRARLFGKGMKPVNPSNALDNLGSDIAGVNTGCGNGWQVLATRNGDLTEPDAIVGLEIVNRQAVAVTPALAFAGPITALWPTPEGQTAVAVSHNLNTRQYEAFSLAVSCSQ